MDYNIDDMKDLITDRFSFRDLRERDLLYIDKTEYIFRLVSSPSRFFFLSRPRSSARRCMSSSREGPSSSRDCISLRIPITDSSGILSSISTSASCRPLPAMISS